MSKIFTTGNITEASTILANTALYNQMKSDILAHPNWEHVETITPASVIAVWDVLKCMTPGNGLEQDFYLILGRTVATGTIYCFTVDDWNPTTKAIKGYGFWQNTTGKTYDAEGRLTDTWVLNITPPSQSGVLPLSGVYASTATTIKWWVIVDDDYFCVAMNGSPNHFFHGGTYIPLTLLQTDAPIFSSQYKQTGTGNDGYITRHPAMAGLTNQKSSALAAYCGGSMTSSGQGYTEALGWLGYDNRFADPLNDNKRHANQVAINLYLNPITDQAIHGYGIGKHPPDRMRHLGSQIPSGSIVWGDTYTLEGKLWVPFLPTDMRIWNTGVAA